MANYPQEPAEDAECQSHTGHMTGLWFLPTRPLRLNTNERRRINASSVSFTIISSFWRLTCPIPGAKKSRNNINCCTLYGKTQFQHFISNRILQNLPYVIYIRYTQTEFTLRNIHTVYTNRIHRSVNCSTLRLLL